MRLHQLGLKVVNSKNVIMIRKTSEIISGWPSAFPKEFLHKMIFNLLSKAGYLLIPKWRLRNLYYYSYIIKLIQHYNINVVIDIGAHQGEFAEGLLLQAGFDGSIFSFEPIRSFCIKMKGKAESYPNWKVYNFAISETEEFADIYLTKNSCFTSLLKPIESVIAEYDDAISVSGREQVEIKTLKWFLGQNKLNLQRTFLKCDTQGNDLRILSSAPELLKEIPIIQTELSIKSYYEGAADSKQILDFMSENNFSLANQFPITFDSRHRIIETDAIFINNRVIV